MTGLDKGRTGNGEPGPGAGGADSGSMPFFPGPAGHQGTVPPPGTPLPAPPAAPAGPSAPAKRPGAGPPPGAATAVQANALPMTLQGSASDVTTAVEGRITIEDEVIEKIAALAALEVTGVAALVARPDPAVPGQAPGPAAGRAGTGVRVVLDEDEVTLDLVIAVEYGSVVKDVAKVVKNNVARVAGVMLGARVAAVNVSVGDVRMPAGSHR
ncbi:Asp23/Gls24 family envelope stress response protein [Actinomadura sp. 3N407]|uniref:Asp23/Gls24 family envelope stress response protein n=1 Tax=Actinomadura sp. 3N407 TaxID=3457423 RepID=UPI003FCD0287